MPTRDPADRVVDVLLVDDNPHDTELTLRAFARAGIAGTVRALADGAKAIDFLLGRGSSEHGTVPLPRVVFLDLKLPLVSGFEVLEAVRADRRTRELPIVVLSSSAETGDVDSAYRLGANSYVVKPVEPATYLTTLGRAGLYWTEINLPR